MLRSTPALVAERIRRGPPKPLDAGSNPAEGFALTDLQLPVMIVSQAIDGRGMTISSGELTRAALELRKGLEGASKNIESGLQALGAGIAEIGRVSEPLPERGFLDRLADFVERTETKH